jgi:hypothetical protein
VQAIAPIACISCFRGSRPGGRAEAGGQAARERLAVVVRSLSVGDEPLQCGGRRHVEARPVWIVVRERGDGSADPVGERRRDLNPDRYTLGERVTALGCADRGDPLSLGAAVWLGTTAAAGWLTPVSSSSTELPA